MLNADRISWKHPLARAFATRLPLRAPQWWGVLLAFLMSAWPAGVSAPETAAAKDDAPFLQLLRATLRADDKQNFLAELDDGSRLRRDDDKRWTLDGRDGPLDETSLPASLRRVRWLQKRLPPGRDQTGLASGWVELVNGDLLAGTVVGIRAAEGTAWRQSPAVLLVRPAAAISAVSAKDPVTIAVRAEMARRVVLPTGRVSPASLVRLDPGRLVGNDGRRVSFRSLRWGSDRVSLLCDDRVESRKLADIAEIRLPHGDFWEPYYRELATFGEPLSAAQIIQLTTDDGLTATITSDRIRPLAEPADEGRARSGYAVQPAWSQTALLVSPARIRALCQWAPHEVALSRIEPQRVVQKSALGQSFVPQRDRSTVGSELYGADNVYLWGFGVHATSELAFSLPACARAFRCRLGLDRCSGDGGCAIARIYADSAKGRPLFETDHLIGSKRVLDTGELAIQGASDGPKELVLLADAAHDGRPDGADPLDIRDHLNWLQPMLLLDPATLSREAASRRQQCLPGLKGWTIRTEGGEVRLAARWDETDGDWPGFVTDIVPQGKTVALSRQAWLGPDDRWLYLRIRQAVASEPPGTVEVRIAGRPVARTPVPPPDFMQPLVLSLNAWQGQDVALETVYTPGSAEERIRWETAAIADRPTRVRWTPLKVAEARSLLGAELKRLDDGSVLASGRSTLFGDTYVVHAETDLPRITAIRLEALADTSLPGGGPGRSEPGGFLLSQLRMYAGVREREAVRGQYVRIEAIGERKKTSLHTAEVQVFAPPPSEEDLLASLSAGGRSRLDKTAKAELAEIIGTEPARRSLRQIARLQAYADSLCDNLAASGIATQSTTADWDKGNFPARANDGNLFTTARSLEEAQPWCEIDLQQERQIDRIVVWSDQHNDNYPPAYCRFRVMVLGPDRGVRWQQEVLSAPTPVGVFGKSPEPVVFRRATETFCERGFTAEQAIQSSLEGWSVAARFGQSHAAAFTLAEPITAPDGRLTLELQHGKYLYTPMRGAIGRFRLLATDEPVDEFIDALPKEIPLTTTAEP